MNTALNDFISGDLDRVFTVLFELGHIEPLLKKDWKQLYRETQDRWEEVSQAIRTLNELHNLKEIRAFIQNLSPEIIDSLVVEVAREMAEYHDRGEETLH